MYCTCSYVHTLNFRTNCTYFGFHNFFLSCSLKNGLTALDIAESRAEEKKRYYYSNFEGVIELLNKHIEEATDPPSHHVSMTVDILSM